MTIHVVRSVFLASALIVVSAFLVSCSTRGPAEDSTLAASLLRKQADAWDQAIIQKNENAIASNMSEDFRHIDKRGSISDKKTFLREIMSPDLVIHPYTVQDFDMRIYGTCALLCGRTQMTGTYQGKPFQSHYRYIDTYSYSNGSWKVVNVQITAIP
ncbi:MAG: nuclear transport factor 2 family protein [Ignavibacteriae bacterium]|nr:nuclear transport factor 2 family protein [Ignavibacteriota bacterium]